MLSHFGRIPHFGGATVLCYLPLLVARFCVVSLWWLPTFVLTQFDGPTFELCHFGGAPLLSYLTLVAPFRVKALYWCPTFVLSHFGGATFCVITLWWCTTFVFSHFGGAPLLCFLTLVPPHFYGF